MIGIFKYHAILLEQLVGRCFIHSAIRLSKHRSRIRRKLANAKQRFLKDEPKRCVCMTAVFSCILMESLSTLLFLWNVRPPNAAAIFRSEKRSEYAPQFPELKAGVWVHLRFHIQIAANLAFIFSYFLTVQGLALNGKLSEIFRGFLPCLRAVGGEWLLLAIPHDLPCAYIALPYRSFAVAISIGGASCSHVQHSLARPRRRGEAKVRGHGKGEQR